MSRHRDHLPGVASPLHFYAMPEAPAISLRDRGLSGCDRLTGREQLVKAVEQLAQAESNHQDRAALASRPHASTRAGGAGDLDIRVHSAESPEPGHLALAGRRHDVHNGPVSCHCHDRGQGDQRHFLAGVQQVPGYPRANTLQEDSLAGSLERDATGTRKALSRGHRRQAAAGVGRMRRSWPALRGRRDSLRPGPADPAGALAAVIAEAAACVDSGPGARCSRRSPRSGRR